MSITENGIKYYSVSIENIKKSSSNKEKEIKPETRGRKKVLEILIEKHIIYENEGIEKFSFVIVS